MTVGAVPGARCAVHPDSVAAGVCDRCGNFYCPSCAGSIEGTRSWCAHCASAGVAYVAWEDRERLGTWRAFWFTLKRSVLNPQEFPKEVPAEGGFGAPTKYALLGTAIGVVPVILLVGLIWGVVLTILAREGGLGPDPPPVWALVVGGVFYLVFLVLSPIGFLFVWAGILRLSSRLLGAPHGTYEGIFRVIAYSAGLNVAMGIPLLSTVGQVFQILHAIFGISSKCGVSGGRAAAIYFLPLLVCGCLFVGAYVFIIVAVVAATGAAGG